MCLAITFFFSVPPCSAEQETSDSRRRHHSLLGLPCPRWTESQWRGPPDHEQTARIYAGPSAAADAGAHPAGEEGRARQVPALWPWAHQRCQRQDQQQTRPQPFLRHLPQLHPQGRCGGPDQDWLQQEAVAAAHPDAPREGGPLQRRHGPAGGGQVAAHARACHAPSKGHICHPHE